MPEMPTAIFALCRGRGQQRNDVAPRRRLFRAIMRKGGETTPVQIQHYAMRAILAILLLCTASGPRAAQAQSLAETIALGKALTATADCASCHTADPAKPF